MSGLRAPPGRLQIMAAGADTFDRLALFNRTVVGTRRGDLPLRLATSVAMINAVLRPGVDVAEINRTLDDLAAKCPSNSFDALRTYMFDDLGFRADASGVSDPRNSMLGDVLRTRRGLPVLIATTVMAVGLRLRVPVTGIGMPFQVLIGDPRRRGRYVDPVAGELWDAAAAQECFMTLAAGRLEWDERFLRPVRTEAIIERILRNLEMTFRQQGAAADLALVVSMMAQLPHMAARAVEARRLCHVFN